MGCRNFGERFLRPGGQERGEVFRFSFAALGLDEPPHNPPRWVRLAPLAPFSLSPLEPQNYRQHFGDSPLAQGRSNKLRASPALGRAGRGVLAYIKLSLPHGVWKKPAITPRLGPLRSRTISCWPVGPLALAVPLTRPQNYGRTRFRGTPRTQGCGDRGPDHTLALGRGSKRSDVVHMWPFPHLPLTSRSAGSHLPVERTLKAI